MLVAMLHPLSVELATKNTENGILKLSDIDFCTACKFTVALYHRRSSRLRPYLVEFDRDYIQAMKLV